MSSDDSAVEGAAATGTLSRSRSSFSWLPIDTVFILLFVVVAFLFARSYMAAERFFYFWDFAAYTGYLDQAAATIRDAGLRQGLAAIYKSTAEEYNQYFTLPLLPFALLTGGLTRVRFVEALAVLFVVPLCLVVGSITACLSGAGTDARHKRVQFWLGALFCLLLPATWAAVLRAYPDVFACFFALLAVSLYCNRGTTFSVRRAVCIGACLSVAMLLRRHFTYPALAFYGAFVIDQALAVWGDPERSGWPARLRGAVSRGVLVFGGHAVVLLVFGFLFVRNLLVNNYYGLYTSYMTPIPLLTQIIGDSLGWSLCGLAGLGWIAMFVVRRQTARQTGLFFVFLYCVLLGGAWILVVRQMGQHYLLHFLLFLVVGLTGLTLLPGRSVIAGGVVALLALNMLSMTLPPDRSPIPLFLRPMLASSRPPLYRKDYAEMTRFMTTLRTVTAPGHMVFVGGSSERMNDDLVRHADPGLPGLLPAGSPVAVLPALRFVASPHVDSRDRYPLEPLLESSIITLPDRAETHLDPKQQKVVLMTGRLFGEVSPVTRKETDTPQSEEISDLFRRDFVSSPESFAMENGTRLRIYRRVRPTPISTAARTLAWMRDVMGGKDPGGQNDWVSLTPLVRVEPQSGGRYLIISQPPAGASDTKPTTPAALGFAYIGDSRSVRITAPKTTSATLKAFVLDAKRGTTQPVPVRVTSESLNTVSVIKAAPTQTSRLLYIVSSLPAGQSVTWECTSGP